MYGVVTTFFFNQVYYYWRLLTCTTKRRTLETVLSSDCAYGVVSGSEMALHSGSDDDNDTLGMEELERGVSHLLKRIPDKLELDSDPELNDERQPSTFTTSGNPG